MKVEILEEAEEESGYFIWADSIWVLAVAHGHRLPEYWLQRKKHIH